MSMAYLDENTIKQLVEAFNQRKLEPVLKLFSDDVVLHVPGKSRIARDYRGKSGVLDFWNQQISLTGGTFKAQVIAVCRGEGHLVLIFEGSAIRDGVSYSWRRVNHYQLVEGRVIEGWVYESDQYIADAAFG
jgi:ketosteroid isomerase-like protein